MNQQGKELTRSQQDYYWYKEHGICTECRKRKAFNGHVLCEYCMEKRSMYDFRKNNTEEGLAKARKRMKDFTDRRKQLGLCVSCGRPATNGTKCAYHAAKQNEWKRRKRIRGNSDSPGNKFSQRINAGLCMYCGEPQVTGYSLCEYHLEKSREERKRYYEKRKSQVELKGA